MYPDVPFSRGHSLCLVVYQSVEGSRAQGLSASLFEPGQVVLDAHLLPQVFAQLIENTELHFCLCPRVLPLASV